MSTIYIHFATGFTTIHQLQYQQIDFIPFSLIIVHSRLISVSNLSHCIHSRQLYLYNINQRYAHFLN